MAAAANVTNQQIRDALHAGDERAGRPAWESRPLGTPEQAFAAQQTQPALIAPVIGLPVLVSYLALERAYDRAHPAANVWVRGQHLSQLPRAGADGRYVPCELIGAQVRDADDGSGTRTPALCLPDDELTVQDTTRSLEYVVRARDCDLDAAVRRPVSLSPAAWPLRPDERP